MKGNGFTSGVQMSVPGRTFRLAIVLAIVVALLMVSSRVRGLEPLGWLTIPVTWPGIVIFGPDETQERLGYWGELVAFWVCSLPCIAAFAWLISLATKKDEFYE